MTNVKTIGSIETGGIKFIIAAQDTESGKVAAADRVPTTSREETLEVRAEFFKKGPINALGIATLGPVDTNSDSRTYGYILDTPESGWLGANFKGFFEKELSIPAYVTTDVNGSYYGEYIARGTDNTKAYLYVTIGTGIGDGAIREGRFIGCNYRPKMDHTMVVRAEGDDHKGGCPFHSACVEGMAVGPSLKGRTDVPGEDLPRDHKAFSFL